MKQIASGVVNIRTIEIKACLTYMTNKIITYNTQLLYALKYEHKCKEYSCVHVTII